MRSALRMAGSCLALALASITVAAAPASAKSKCIALTDEQVSALEIASSTSFIQSGFAVKVPEKKRSTSGWPTYFVAAEIINTAGGINIPGVWAVGGISPYGIAGPIDSLTDVVDAARTGDWPTPPYPALKQRKRLTRLPQFDAALECLGATRADDDPRSS